VTDYVKQLRELLREAGFEFLRHGKGSHDIWRNPMTGKSVAIQRRCHHAILLTRF